LFEANVIAINPTAEEFKDILGMELKEDSKATEYLGETTKMEITIYVLMFGYKKLTLMISLKCHSS
jgi:hypothetical protein